MGTDGGPGKSIDIVPRAENLVDVCRIIGCSAAYRNAALSLHDARARELERERQNSVSWREKNRLAENLIEFGHLSLEGTSGLHRDGGVCSERGVLGVNAHFVKGVEITDAILLNPGKRITVRPRLSGTSSTCGHDAGEQESVRDSLASPCNRIDEMRGRRIL